MRKNVMYSIELFNKKDFNNLSVYRKLTVVSC